MARRSKAWQALARRGNVKSKVTIEYALHRALDDIAVYRDDEIEYTHALDQAAWHVCLALRLIRMEDMPGPRHPWTESDAS